MNPKRPRTAAPDKSIPAGDVRFSAEVISAAEKSAGRSLRSPVPDLPPEERRQDR